MAERGCALCVVWEDGKGGRHHQRNCPEMSFASGRRRDDPGPSAPLPPLNPDLKLPLHQESPLSEAMAKIFSGQTEANIKAHLEARRGH